MYESRAYDNEHGDPVVVLVTTGTHDVSRLIQLFNANGALCEQITVGEQMLRQAKRHNGGRAAVTLLKAHGGPDFTDAVGADSPTDPAALGAWLRDLPDGTILRSDAGNAWQLHFGVESGAGDDREFRAMLSALGEELFEITEGHPNLEALGEGGE